jgi:diguanylate cyclase (GGDEF)-like protein
VLSTAFGGSYFGSVIAGITSATAAVNGKIIAIQTLDAGTWQLDLAEPPKFRQNVAMSHISAYAVILNAVNRDYMVGLRAAGKPAVMISDTLPGLECPVVQPDNRTGIRSAVAHLIEHGHTAIAFAGFPAQKDISERYKTYRETLVQHGIRPDPRLFFSTGNNQENGGERAAHAMIAAGMPSTAVIAGNDLNAVGLMRTLQAAGYELPRDQAVVGFDDMEVSVYASPALASVRQHFEAVGAKAVRLLLRQLRGEPVLDDSYYVPTEFIPRESCGCPSTLSLRGDPSRPIAVASSRSELESLLSEVFDLDGENGPQLSGPLARGVTVIDEAIQAAVDDQPAPDTFRLRRALADLHGLNSSPECLVDVMRRVRAYGRRVAAGQLAADDVAGRIRVEDCLQELTLGLSQAQARSRFVDVSHFEGTFTVQHAVSMGLLRSSHEEDPRTLDWLQRTPARAACLGLWTAESPESDHKPTLSVVGTFSQDASLAPCPKGPTLVEDFPPAELVSLAQLDADDMVFIAPMKVNASDWGMLAVVGPVEARLATGREIMNQWAALLTIALDHGAVLESLRLQEERLRHAALYDELTGLPNRTLFFERLVYAISRAERRSDYHFCVFLLDLDGFKVVNDSLGHLAGDRLLVEVAERVRSFVRGTDVAARLGGDEFAIFFDDLSGAERAGVVARRLQEALAEPVLLDGQKIVISASIGVALSDNGYHHPEEVIRDADIAMYDAKSREKGSHAVFDVAMHTKAVKRLRTEGELRRAVDNRELELFYQPIVELDDGSTAAFEALIRWRHPSKGIVLPSEFLPVAEESGLMIPIGTWVLGEACRQLGRWVGEGTAPQVRMSVNVSNRQFWNGRLAEDVQDMLERADLEPSRLAIEITEGIIMHDVKLARRRMEELHELGVELHIDDFGTGYSSLEALHYLPIDALKIDRSFVSRLGTDGRSEELVRAIVAMGTSLGLALVAEGIETPEHRDQLRDLGCRYGQGYWFSRPMPAAQAGSFAAGDALETVVE